MIRYDEDGYPIRDIEYKLQQVRDAIATGADPVNAINRNCNTGESYAAALKEHGLRPVIPD